MDYWAILDVDRHMIRPLTGMVLIKALTLSADEDGTDLEVRG
jgi:hypothetical protein